MFHASGTSRWKRLGGESETNSSFRRGEALTLAPLKPGASKDGDAQQILRYRASQWASEGCRGGAPGGGAAAAWLGSSTGRRPPNRTASIRRRRSKKNPLPTPTWHRRGGLIHGLTSLGTFDGGAGRMDFLPAAHTRPLLNSGASAK